MAVETSNRDKFIYTFNSVLDHIHLHENHIAPLEMIHIGLDNSVPAV